MAPNIYCAGAGTAADCDKTTATMASQLELLRSLLLVIEIQFSPKNATILHFSVDVVALVHFQISKFEFEATVMKKKRIRNFLPIAGADPKNCPAPLYLS